MAITEQELAKAEARMAETRAAGHAVSARYDRRRSRVVVALNTGIELTFPTQLAEGLADASPEERKVVYDRLVLMLDQQLRAADPPRSDKDILKERINLEGIKARLKPKKTAITAEMLDTANSYDDKVAVIRILVGDDSSRVTAVLKQMIQRDLN